MDNLSNYIWCGNIQIQNINEDEIIIPNLNLKRNGAILVLSFLETSGSNGTICFTKSATKLDISLSMHGENYSFQLVNDGLNLKMSKKGTLPNNRAVHLMNIKILSNDF